MRTKFVRVLTFLFVGLWCFHAAAEGISISITPNNAPNLYAFDPYKLQKCTATIVGDSGSILSSFIEIHCDQLPNPVTSTTGSVSLDIPLNAIGEHKVFSTGSVTVLTYSPYGYSYQTISLDAVPITFTVVGVGSLYVDDGKSVICAGDRIGVNAFPEPSTVAFPAGNPMWTDTTIGFVDPMNQTRFIVSNTYIPAVITITATCGYSIKSTQITAAQVSLVPVAYPERALDLPKGNCCTNAQDVYLRAKWSASVKPATISAIGKVDSGPVALADTEGATTITLNDGSTFDVIVDGSGSTGSYVLSITAGTPSTGTCSSNSSGICFKFLVKATGVNANPDASTAPATVSVKLTQPDAVQMDITLGAAEGDSGFAARIATMDFMMVTSPENGYSGHVHTTTELSALCSGAIEMKAPGKASSVKAKFKNQVNVQGLYFGDKKVVKTLTKPIQNRTDWLALILDTTSITWSQPDAVYEVGTGVVAGIQPILDASTTGLGEVNTTDATVNGFYLTVSSNFEIVP